jgi:hypothetical protein
MLGEKTEKRIMVTATDLIEDWIEMRSKLQRQLKMLEAGEMHVGDNISESATTATVVRLKKCVSELNELLKEYGRAPAKSPISDEAAIGDDPESHGDPYIGSAK